MLTVMQKFNTPTVDSGLYELKNGYIFRLSASLIIFMLQVFKLVYPCRKLDAFIYDASVLEFKASQENPCTFKIVGKWSSMTGYSIGFPKKSKWINTFDKQLFRLQHDGA